MGLRDIELPFSLKSTLQDFTRDLTAAAITDELEPVRCRENEIDRIITTLLRQSKNNPVLVGEAGVGKTAVVEGLAQRVGAGSVPLSLKAARILSLSHIDLIAGTSFRGQYEKRLQAVINEASADPNVILFIDELHNLIGAGSAVGAPMDAANMLKPALASGQLRVIGATTEIEYDRFIRSDAALERRFQPVLVRELGREETLEVLRARRNRLEMHHLVAISDAALEAAVEASARYLPDRKQPDRSIDLLDESCARLRMLQPVDLPPAIIELKAERDRLIATKRESIKEMLAVAEARGNPIERFSRGTFRMFEAMGLGVEKILTGQTTPRRPLPLPDSVRRIQERDPIARLAQLHYEQLRVEDGLKQLLTEDGLVIKAEHIEATVSSMA